MQIHQLRYMLEIAKEKNISAAAKNLFLSQPSLSQQIINLEKEFNIPLLIRHSKSVSLTDAGEEFVLSAQRIMNEFDQLSELMQKYSLLEKGTLHIGLLWIAGYLDLCQVLTNYHLLYPNISYSIKVNGSAHLLQMLLERSLNAAFLISSDAELQTHEELYYKKIVEDYYVALVPKQHPLSKKKTLTMEDLRFEDLIIPAKESTFRKELEQLFDHHFVTPNIVCETSQSDIVIQLVSQNFAIGFSSYSIAVTLQQEQVAIVPLKEPLYRNVYYVTLKELLNYPSIHSFTSFVEQYDFFSHRNLINPKKTPLD